MRAGCERRQPGACRSIFRLGVLGCRLRRVAKNEDCAAGEKCSDGEGGLYGGWGAKLIACGRQALAQRAGPRWPIGGWSRPKPGFDVFEAVKRLDSHTRARVCVVGAIVFGVVSRSTPNKRETVRSRPAGAWKADSFGGAR